MNLSPHAHEIMVRKLHEQRVIELSDAEIERAFSGCVASERLTRLAKEYRDAGALTIEQVNK